MKVLLTGGAGYIGSHTAMELLAHGHKVAVFDDLSNGNIESLRRVEEMTGAEVEFVQVDLRKRADTRLAFESVKDIDAVIHFAGVKAVGESISHPIDYYATNLGSTLVLLEEMKERAIHKLIFSSSATVYGDPSVIPVKEEAEVGVRLSNPYGRTKAMIEQILLDASVSDANLAVSVLRYFNPIGAHHSGRIGEDPQQVPNNLLPIISRVAAGRLSEVLVFGDRYPTIDGSGVRDYVHVMDLAAGHVAALERAKGGFNAYNLGTGRGTSVFEVISAFSEASGRRVPYRVVAPRAGDVATSVADVSKARAELGWTAQRSISDACRDAWAWQSSNPLGFC